MGNRTQRRWIAWLAVVTSLCLAMSTSEAEASDAGSGDGEGIASIEPAKRLVAGAVATVTITVTVGESGIPVGGGVMLGLHHASRWRDLQIEAADKRGYMTVTDGRADNFELEWHPWWVPKEAIPEIGDSIFHRCLIARVKRTALVAGDEVKMILGGNGQGITVQSTVEKTAEFHVMTDVDGDGVYKGLARQPIVEIVASEAHHLVGSLPSTIVSGEAFDLQIRAEDEFFNMSTGYSGRVTVRIAGGEVIAKAVRVTDGVARVELETGRVGPLKLELSDGRLAGWSNPARVFETAPGYRTYWGDFHGHTSLSDGLGDTANDYYAFARDVADLDVCALTDHGVPDWEQTRAAVKKFYEPGKYVTILGLEGPSSEGHMLLLFRDPDEEPISAWPSTHDAYVAHVLEQYGVDGRLITGPAHFASAGNGESYPFGTFDERIMRFVEIYSMSGTSEYPTNPRPMAGGEGAKEDFVQSGLARGLRFGLIGTSDNHDSHPGRNVATGYPGGLVAIRATELTREAIWDALWNRRVYATSFDRIYLEFTIDDHVMGSSLTASGPTRVNYYVAGATQQIEVFLIRNNEEIRADRSENGVVEVSFEDEAPAGQSFYYVRAVQSNGERAWSTPIWVARK